ncbi:Glucan endo-alpha-glucosidase Agn1 [Apiospora rasikravindrae]|uniref:Glucan endo-alpha-glucosidase Agn1 n=1 Tax=Apiospora rasikravindrae TaxID=990691 RepID=A0ABR1SMZ6_9PEZI
MLKGALVTAVAALAHLAAARDVFAHYMVQGLDGGTNHAVQDVIDAKNMGIAAFALNIGQPSAGWATDAMSQLFKAAKNNGFKLFFSMDLAQTKDAYAYSDLLKQYAGHDAYYRAGPNKLPFLSTFSAQGTDANYWTSFLGSFGQTKFYFVPNFDDTPNYFDNPSTWMNNWGKAVDGVFSWETAWPRNSNTPSNVSSVQDENVLKAAHAKKKAYMMPLSTLQYKHWSGQHWYRPGEVNMPQRMTEILDMGDRADYVEIITWNDAGESHYIGTLRMEGIDKTMVEYANNDNYTHVAWQPVFTSFIYAFNNGLKASDMRPPNGKQLVGSMWYRAIKKSASCKSDPQGRPSGAGAAQDAVNWAIVAADSGLGNLRLQIWSGGQLIRKVALQPGLNYGSEPGMATGPQYFEVIDIANNNKILMKGQGSVDVKAESTGYCNYNYVVAGLN